MLTRSFFAASAALAFTVPGPANAQGTDFHQGSTYAKVVEHGKTIVLGYFYELNPDCTSVGDFSVYVTSQPQGGMVTFAQSRDFPTYPADNIRSRCNARRVNVTKVFYKASKRFIGNDSFGLQSVTFRGNPINFNIQVAVR